jgi:ABC-type antimicrobial peptide transport system permease subunit
MIFMREKDLGYDKENLIYVNMRGDLSKNYKAIKSELIKTKGVVSVSGTLYPPHRMTANGDGAEWDGKAPDQRVLIGASFVDYNYCSTMNIKILEGRDFSEEFPSDLVSDEDTVGGFLVNEEVVKVMGLNYKQAIGARFDNFGCTGKIVGVMQDFNFKPVRTKIEPIAFALVPDYLQFVVVRLAAGNIFNSITNLENAWKTVEPNYPFDFKFLDEELDGMYRTENRMLGLLKYFSIFAVFIACLGLFGLAAFAAEQRTKEIGIRKVLGATEFKLTYLLCKEFIILVIIANLIAWIFSYYASTKWLEDFAYRIDVNPFFFLTAGILSLVIAILTVSYQAIKAALANPVDSLKYE